MNGKSSDNSTIGREFFCCFRLVSDGKCRGDKEIKRMEIISCAQNIRSAPEREITPFFRFISVDNVNNFVYNLQKWLFFA